MPSNYTQAYLEKVKNLIEDPNHWTRDASARNARGNGCSEHFKGAVCFCLTGALNVVSRDFPVVASHCGYSCVYQALEELSLCRSIVAFNDSHKHADVMQVLDKAIEFASQRNSEIAEEQHGQA